MIRLYNKIYFLFGLCLFLFGLLIAILMIDSAIEGFDTENKKIGAAVISFLMSPVTASGLYLAVNYRPRRRKKRIKLKQIVKVIRKKGYRLTNIDIVTNMNLTTEEATALLKELVKIGLGELGKDRYGRNEFIIFDSASLHFKKRDVGLMHGIRSLMISTGFIRIFVCIILIASSIIGLVFRLNDCCGNGFYYLIILSFASVLSTTYIIWWHKRNSKKKFPQFIEINKR